MTEMYSERALHLSVRLVAQAADGHFSFLGMLVFA